MVDLYIKWFQITESFARISPDNKTYFHSNKPTTSFLNPWKQISMESILEIQTQTMSILQESKINKCATCLPACWAACTALELKARCARDVPFAFTVVFRVATIRSRPDAVGKGTLLFLKASISILKLCGKLQESSPTFWRNSQELL